MRDEEQQQPEQIDEPSQTSTPIQVESNEREGNDVQALIGAGTPMVKVKANAGLFDLSVGETGILLQTEEVRLNVANGNLSIVED